MWHIHATFLLGEHADSVTYLMGFVATSVTDSVQISFNFYFPLMHFLQKVSGVTRDVLWLTPLIVTQGTYWCGGFRPAVWRAFWCISWFPRSPFTQPLSLSMLSWGSYTFRHCRQQAAMNKHTWTHEHTQTHTQSLRSQLSPERRWTTPYKRWLGRPCSSCSVNKSVKEQSRPTRGSVVSLHAIWDKQRQQTFTHKFK